MGFGSRGVGIGNLERARAHGERPLNRRGMGARVCRKVVRLEVSGFPLEATVGLRPCCDSRNLSVS